MPGNPVMRKIVLTICAISLFVAGCKKEETVKVQQQPSESLNGNLERNTSAVPDLIPYNVKGISRVTGKTQPSGDSYINPNQTDVKYDVGGTDLGIMWDAGNGFTGLVFGDTFGRDWVYTTAGGANGSNWRSNVVGMSSDLNLDNGLTISAMRTDQNGAAKEVIPSPHNTSGNGSLTSIPTAAVRVDNTDYIHYMDIRQWGPPGIWTTNLSGVYYSSNNWETSTKSAVSFAANSNFAQAAYAKKDGYIYMIGTPAGRNGSAYLARFLQNNILLQTEYEYWNGTSGWVKNNEASATPIFDAPVAEISLVYNTHFNRWILTYLHGTRYALVMRSAENITGTWGPARTLVTGSAIPGLYGGYIHPLKNNSTDLYFLLSVWQPYNVFLVRSKLKME
ncbi:MAG: DUF4185 domain-containing protein [Sphingobacteriales bacterium]|nr:MAG: DUF4185 domain-containing protein [Sphingobacteriales bacterium]